MGFAACGRVWGVCGKTYDCKNAQPSGIRFSKLIAQRPKSKQQNRRAKQHNRRSAYLRHQTKCPNQCEHVLAVPFYNSSISMNWQSVRSCAMRHATWNGRTPND
eukprot:764351-Amphidinium_carterae.1